MSRLIFQQGIAPVTSVNVSADISLNSLADVTLTSLANGQFLVYNSSTEDFENKTITDLEGDISEIDGGSY